MKRSIVFGIATALLTAGSAMADSTNFAYYATPTYSGNVNFPSVPSEVATITAGPDTITLASTATARYSSPVLGISSPGVFTAGAGYATAVPPGTPAGSLWNYDFYINISNPANIGNYTFRLLYETTPGGAFSTLTLPSAALGESFSNGTLNDGQNLGVLGIPPFDPNATGVYSFQLQVLNANNTVIGASDIQVDVTSVPEGSSTLALLSLAVLAMGAGRMARRESVA